MEKVRHSGGCQHLMVPAAQFKLLSGAGTFTITGVRPIDGRNWEKHYPDGRGEYE